MIIVLKANTPKEEAKKLVDAIKAKGLQVDISKGARQTVMGLVGNTEVVDVEQIQSYECVDKVMRVEVPYKRASRAFHPQDSVIPVGNSGVTIGGKKLAVIAGPCSIETPDQIEGVACDVAKAGANILRGGAFKPRTSPYSFQGLGNKGLDMLRDAGRKAKLPVITEIMSADKLPVFLEDGVDIIQIGARNMQNFDLLKAVGKTRKPALLKRTFETYTRNTLDLSAVLAVKRQSHLPIVVDPSHATGKRWMVADLAKAAVAAGADGLMIEVHNDPDKAWCDGAQSITPAMFADLMDSLRKLAPVVGREI